MESLVLFACFLIRSLVPTSHIDRDQPPRPVFNTAAEHALVVPFAHVSSPRKKK